MSGPPTPVAQRIGIRAATDLFGELVDEHRRIMLAQNRPVQLLELSTGLDAKLVGERQDRAPRSRRRRKLP